MSNPSPATMRNDGPWWRELTGYHWFVLIVATLGWVFDCLDQQLFILARVPAMQTLLGPDQDPSVYAEGAGYATAIFLIGWATGGLVFGVLGDRIGRAKTMMLTILLYSVCTGLSALSQGFWDFAFYRFMTGLGVGGEFAVGVALVAEVMPERARPYALGLLQALSAVGNISAAFIKFGFSSMVANQTLTSESSWRMMFVVGALPALLALVVRLRLKEPAKWKAAKESEQFKGRLGSYGELFGNPGWRRPAGVAAALVAAIILMAFAGPAEWNKLTIGVLLALAALVAGGFAVFGGGQTAPPWRRNAVVGLLLACSGVIALWGIVFFSFDLIASIFQKDFVAQGMDPAQIKGEVGKLVGKASIMLNLGAFFGIYGFSVVGQRLGRKPTFAIVLVCALLSTAGVFVFLKTSTQVFWMMPIMGFFMLAIFGGYAVYFPELFPTHLRSTGTSFCYNVGRFIAASGPAVLGILTGQVFDHTEEPMRWAGLSMCAIFLLGLAVLPFAPETKDKPLPE